MAPATIAGGLVNVIKAMIDARQKTVYAIDNKDAYDPESFEISGE